MELKDLLPLGQVYLGVGRGDSGVAYHKKASNLEWTHWYGTIADCIQSSGI